MHDLFTLRDLSAAIATAEKRPDEERIFQQLKGASARGLLTHQDTHGPKGALRFDLVEAAKARVILRALDSGVAGEQLQQFVDDLRVETRKALPNGLHVTLSLSEAVATVNEVHWMIEVVQTRATETDEESEAGEPDQSVLWLRDGVRFGAIDPLDPAASILGKVIEEVRHIPFSALVRPIFAELLNG